MLLFVCSVLVFGVGWFLGLIHRILNSHTRCWFGIKRVL